MYLTKTNKSFYLIGFVGMILCMVFNSNAAVLPLVKIEGDDGGLPNGGIWSSDDLDKKINLVLYVDPDKKGAAEPLVNRLDSLLNSIHDSLSVTFILNTEATIIPNFIIRNRLKKKAEQSPFITYVLDERRTLVKKWNLIDNEINVLIVDKNGAVLFNHSGKMSREYMDKFLNRLDHLFNKGELK